MNQDKDQGPAVRGEAVAESTELEAVLAENDRLREALADKISGETLLTELNMNGGGLNMQFEGGACQMLAEQFAQQFREMGGDNYIEMGFTARSDNMPLLVTIQRVSGKTPATLKTEAEAKLATAKNFHRSLCDRFGYSHDDQDWMRDLASLEEHIAAKIKSRAADALDSQPTVLAYVATDLDGRADVGMTREKAMERAGPSCDTIIPVYDLGNSQPTVAAQQGSIADDAQFVAALRKLLTAHDQRVNGPAGTALVSLIDSRASSAPVAPIAPRWTKFLSAAEDLARATVERDAMDGIKDGEPGAPSFDTYVDACALVVSTKANLMAAYRDLNDDPQQEGSEAGNG